MRIIGGAYKGRKLHPPKSLPVRPTTDFAKESLFNILTNRFDFEQMKALDLFAGTGNVSFELASRGCTDILCVDKNEGCIRFIKQTAAMLATDAIHTRKMDVFHFLKDCTEQYDLIFADPPYSMEGIEKIPELVFEKNLLAANGWLVLEHEVKKSFDNHKRFTQKRTYGSSVLSIFE